MTSKTTPAVATLAVGDTVLWRGGFGGDAPQPAVVTGIEVCEHERDKYGTTATTVAWDRIRHAVVDLDNGHWAYGDQLSPKEA